MSVQLSQAAARWLVACLMILGLSAGLLPLRPPEPVPATASPDRFSSGRAWAHMSHLARSPHPIGTAEHARVRRYIVEQVERLGLEVEVQTETVLVRRQSGLFRAAEVRNVLTRVPGTVEGGPAVLLVAHYDSVPTSPGAGDDGAGVAALLESLRALSVGGRLRNDVIFLFSDAEEAGLLGALAFAENHRWAERVALILNFEGRGTAGPSIMFETSEGNAPVIGAFARSAPRPVAYSYAGDVYQHLGHRTDLTVLRDLGVPALNFAFISGPFNYHTSNDRIEHLSERSLQHHGSYSLAIARDQADREDLGSTEESGDAVFWTVPGLLLHHPVSLVWPFSLVACVVALAALFAGLRSSRLRWLRLGAGFVVLGAGLVIAYLAATLLQEAVLAIGGPPRRVVALTVGLALALTAVALAGFRGLRRWLAPAELAGSALLIWVLATLAVSSRLPGASYLFTWPLLFGGLSLHLFLTGGRPGGDTSRVGLWWAVGLAVAGAVVLVLWPPVLGLIAVALGLADVPYLMGLVFLLVALLLPQLEVVAGDGGRWAALAIPGVLLLGAVIALGLAAAGPEPPPGSSLVLFEDQDSSESWWVSFDEEPGPWTGRYLGSDPRELPFSRFFDVGEMSVLAAPAPTLSPPGPSVTRVRDERSGGARAVTLRIRSEEEIVKLRLRSDTEVTGVLVGDLALELPPGEELVLLDYYAPPTDGFELTVETAGAGSVDLTVIEQGFGLPELPSGSVSRPDKGEVADEGWWSDCTFVRRSYRF